jgi:hypothetical protein
MTNTPKAQWVRDDDVSAWCLQAPPGYRLGADLHEYVYDFDMWRGRSREAKQAAFQRLREEGGVQLCPDPECEWCRS